MLDVLIYLGYVVFFLAGLAAIVGMLIMIIGSIAYLR